MGRITFLLAGLLASVAIAELTPAAARTLTVPELGAGPLVLKKLGRFTGYRMVVTAAHLGSHAIVAVAFTRVQGGVTQTTAYTFTLPQGALSISRDLRTARLSTGTGLGRFGTIRMLFAGRGGAGGLRGTLQFRTPLGLIRARSLPAKIALKKLSTPGSSGGRPNCRQYPHATVLALIPTSHPRSFQLTTLLAARQRTGPLALLAAFVRHRPPATEAVGLAGAIPRSALTLRGIRTARLDAGRMPFLTGRVSFSRTGPLPGCTSRAAVGTAIGPLRARLDFFGTVPLLAPGSRTGAILIGPA